MSKGNPHRNQTRVWVTKDKRRLRICEMSDSHLKNTMKMLERYAKAVGQVRERESTALNCMVSGDMAQYYAESEMLYALENSDGEDILERLNNGIYFSMQIELMRREWENEK